MFRKVYTYLKRQTLPTSLLLKNRLLVERQWKHRRIMSNFGTTFRNSKWSDYSSQNVTPRMNIQLLSGLGKILSVVVLGVSLSWAIFVASTTDFDLLGIFYPSTSSICNVFGSLINTLIDGWSLIPLYGTLLTHLLATNGLIAVVWVWSTAIFPNNTNNRPSPSETPLLASNLSDNLVLRSLREDTFTVASLDQRRASVLTLYKTLQHPSLVRPHLTVDNVNPYAGLMVNMPHTLTSVYTNTLIHDDNRWALSAIHRERTTLDTQTPLLRGPFYMTSLDYNFLTLVSELPELRFVATHLRSGLKLNKSIRWLYRYSMLHRKSTKRAHFLTLTKQLVSSGFFGEHMTARNLWAAGTFFPATFNSPKIASIVGAQYRLLYGNWRQQTNTSNESSALGYQVALTQSDLSLPQLKYIERSFYFMLKRLHFFNTLPTTGFSAAVTPRVTLDVARETTLTSLESRRTLQWFLLEGMMSSSSLVLPNLNFDIRPTVRAVTNMPNCSYGSTFDTFVTTQDLTLWHESMCTLVFDLMSYTSTTTSTYYYSLFGVASPFTDDVVKFGEPTFHVNARTPRRRSFYRASYRLWNAESSLISDLRTLLHLTK